MTKALRSNGFIVDSGVDMVYSQEAPTSTNPAKSSFKDIFEEYCEILENKKMFSFVSTIRQERIEFDKPLVKEAYQILGPDKVREMKYHVSNIKRAITAKWKGDEDVKITRMVNDSLPKQIPIPAKKVKELLQQIYDELGICKTAKAKDLAQWYDIKVSTKRIDGNPTYCISIIRPYINFGI